MVNFERFEMRLDPETAEKIDSWRNKNNANKTRAETVRELVSIGYEAKDNDKLYEIFRLNVLLNPERFSNATIFALSFRMHPFMEYKRAFDPFKNISSISKIDYFLILDYLNKRSSSNTPTNYYDLEIEFRYKERGIPKSTLIIVCRYLFLSRSFNEKYWEFFVKDEVSDAQTIIRPFDLDEELDI
jgi:hypothetical protein